MTTPHKPDCAHVPPTEEELKNLDEYARQNGGVNSHLILTLIAEVRRLREELDEAKLFVREQIYLAQLGIEEDLVLGGNDRAQLEDDVIRYKELLQILKGKKKFTGNRQAKPML